MAQTIEGFVGTALDDARMSPNSFVADYVILGVARRTATRQSRSG
jgi:hypothetical protein